MAHVSITDNTISQLTIQYIQLSLIP
jgi:hypothetical protein